MKFAESSLQSPFLTHASFLLTLRQQVKGNQFAFQNTGTMVLIMMWELYFIITIWAVSAQSVEKWSSRFKAPYGQKQIFYVLYFSIITQTLDLVFKRGWK